MGLEPGPGSCNSPTIPISLCQKQHFIRINMIKFIQNYWKTNIDNYVNELPINFFLNKVNEVLHYLFYLQYIVFKYNINFI